MTKAYLSNIIPFLQILTSCPYPLNGVWSIVKELGPLSSERPSVYDSLAIGEELW